MSAAMLGVVWTDLVAAMSDGRVWFSFVIALALGTTCLLAGSWLARRMGLLALDAPLGEIMGVGLGTGLLVFAAFWAAVFSRGMSAFTPVAVACAIAIALGLRRKAPPRQSSSPPRRFHQDLRAPRRSLVNGLLAGAAFVVLVGLLYGLTIAPSPRAGVQPVEFLDEAYYSVLGADLAETGVESIYSPSGFEHLPAFPTQTWYHWGETWISAAVITIFGIDPLLARHYVVLPPVLLAAAALTGTLVRRLAETTSTRAFLFGAAACLFLAPFPMPGTFFTSWATGLIFGVTTYGMGAVAVLLGLNLLARGATRATTLGQSTFSAAVLASLVPTHIVLATLALVAAVSVAALQLVRTVWTPTAVSRTSYVGTRTLILTGMLVIATVLWGGLTGHGIGTSAASSVVQPFNEAWRTSVASTVLGAGVLLAIPTALWLVRGETTARAAIFAGTSAALVVGAVAWGARLGDFTMFHVYFGGIAVFGTAAAASAAWIVLSRLRERGRLRLAFAGFLLCTWQLQIGAVSAVHRLYQFGPHDYDAIPEAILTAIAATPPDAKIAYVCQAGEEVAFWDPRLVSITAHTGRRVIPMCFQSEVFGFLNGVAVPPDIPSPLFEHAPQSTIYPHHGAQPSDAVIAAFMKDHGIEYIYVDRIHRNSLVPDAVRVAASGEFEVLRVP